MAEYLNIRCRSGWQKRNSTTAFSLIELLVVLLILGILASLAYPSYSNQVRKGRRADAQAALYDLAQALERYYTATHDYSTAKLGAGGVFSDSLPQEKERKYFNLLIDETTNQSYYKIRAVAITGTTQAKDACPNLWLDSIGNTGAEKQGAALADCW